jgi:hypothetical protein
LPQIPRNRPPILCLSTMAPVPGSARPSSGALLPR